MPPWMGTQEGAAGGGQPRPTRGHSSPACRYPRSPGKPTARRTAPPSRARAPASSERSSPAARPLPSAGAGARSGLRPAGARLLQQCHRQRQRRCLFRPQELPLQRSRGSHRPYPDRLLLAKPTVVKLYSSRLLERLARDHDRGPRPTAGVPRRDPALSTETAGHTKKGGPRR